MISRETNPIDDAYLGGARELLGYLTNAEAMDVSVRVTQVVFDAANNTYEQDWSETEGAVSAATNAMVASWAAKLPVMPDNERVIVVETFHQYDPPFNTGLINREVRNFVFTRPRYAPQVLFN